MARLTGFAAAAILGLTVGSASAQVLPAPVRQQAAPDPRWHPGGRRRRSRRANRRCHGFGAWAHVGDGDDRRAWPLRDPAAALRPVRPSYQSHRLCLDAPRRRACRYRATLRSIGSRCAAPARRTATRSKRGRSLPRASRPFLRRQRHRRRRRQPQRYRLAPAPRQAQRPEGRRLHGDDRRRGGRSDDSRRTGVSVGDVVRAGVRQRGKRRRQLLHRDAVLGRGQPADDLVAGGHGAAALQRLRATRHRLPLDRRAGGERPLGRARLDEPVRRVGVDRRRDVQHPNRRGARFGVRRVVQHAAVPEPSRRARSASAARRRLAHVGEIYGSDRWIASPTLAVDYGARYAHYDYLRRRSLLSPRAGVDADAARRRNSLERARCAAHARAWCRGVSRAVDGRSLAAAGAHVCARSMASPCASSGRGFSTSAQPQFDDAYIVGVRRFQQRVDNQLVTLFGVPVDGGPAVAGPLLRRHAGSARRRRLGLQPDQRAGRAPSTARSSTASRAPTGSRAATWQRSPLGAGRDPAAQRRRPRSDDVARNRSAADSHAHIRALSLQQRVRQRHRSDAHGRRLPFRRAGEPGAAVHAIQRDRRAGKCWSACATCSAIPATSARSTTSYSSSARPSGVIGGVLIKF